MKPVRQIAVGLALSLALPAHAVIRAVPKVSVRPALTGAAGAAAAPVARVTLGPALGSAALKPAALATPVLSAASSLAPSVRVPAAAGALPAARQASPQAAALPGLRRFGRELRERPAARGGASLKFFDAGLAERPEAPTVAVPDSATAVRRGLRASEQAPGSEAQAEFRTPAAQAAPAEPAKRDLQEPEPMTGAQMLAGFLVWLALVGLVALEYGLIYWAITQAPSSYTPTPEEYMIPPGIDPWDIFR